MNYARFITQGCLLFKRFLTLSATKGLINQHICLMKRFSFFLLVLPILASCSKQFYQIATISTDLDLKDNGVYVQSTPDFEILYDFWDNSGVVRFVLHNKSDQDIYLDLTRSFFIKNGLSYDYYQNRTWTTGSVVSSSSSLSMSKSRASYGSATGQLFYQPSIIATLGLGSSYSMGVGGAVSSSSSSAVTIKEPEGIWIPAHASRVFSEFSIMSSPYRECGFDRYPKEETELEFTYENSPVVFTNQLYIKIGSAEKQVICGFYISNVKNVSEKKATYYEYETDLCGNEVSTEKKGATAHSAAKRMYMKDASPNKFYIKYIQDATNDIKKGSSGRQSF